MLDYLWVGIGGALGSVAQFWISGLVAQRYGPTFSCATSLSLQTLAWANGSEWFYTTVKVALSVLLLHPALWIGSFAVSVMNKL